MGYETTLFFVNTYGNKSGFCNIEASLELCKVAYDEMGDLINKAGVHKDAEKKHSLIKKHQQLYKTIYDAEGNYQETYDELSDETKKKIKQDYDKASKELDSKLYYIYLDGELESYVDSYGDLLKVTTIEELEDAIRKSQAKMIVNDGSGYWRFDLALEMIRTLKEKGKSDYKVILWGH